MTDTPPPPRRRSTKLAATTALDNPTPPVAAPPPPAPAVDPATVPPATTEPAPSATPDPAAVPLVQLMGARRNPWREVAQSGNRLPVFLEDAISALVRSSGGTITKRQILALAAEHYIEHVLGRPDALDLAWQHCGGPDGGRDTLRPR